MKTTYGFILTVCALMVLVVTACAPQKEGVFAENYAAQKSYNRIGTATAYNVYCTPDVAQKTCKDAGFDGISSWMCDDVDHEITPMHPDAKGNIIDPIINDLVANCFAHT